jgi:lysozyme
MSTPKAPEKLIRDILTQESLLTVVEPCAILGVRGYYQDTMGVAGRNDVGQYDDAMFFVGPGIFLAANANTDPSRLGWNEAVGKPFAMLLPGLWYFIRGAHKGKVPALRQADEDQADDVKIPNHGHFKVWRGKSMDDILTKTAKVDEGYHAINIHRGGENTTSSWGCQTVPPDQFDNFMEQVWEHTKKHSMERIPYLLIDGPVT